VSKEISHKPSFPRPALRRDLPAPRAKVFRRHHPKPLAFLCFFAPLVAEKLAQKAPVVDKLWVG